MAKPIDIAARISAVILGENIEDARAALQIIETRLALAEMMGQIAPEPKLGEYGTRLVTGEALVLPR